MKNTNTKKLKPQVQEWLEIICIISLFLLGSIVDFEVSFSGIATITIVALAAFISMYLLTRYGDFKEE